MDLAVLTSLVARKPIILRTPSSNISRTALDLATISTAYSVECETLSIHELANKSHDSPTGSISNDINILIVRDIETASRNVQVALVPLIRAKAKTDQLFTVIALIADPEDSNNNPRVPITPHLNDHFLFAYDHPSDAKSPSPASMSATTLRQMQKPAAAVRTTPSMRRYIHDIPTHLRLHRAVAGGVSAVSTRHLEVLARVLAVLNDFEYLTPSLVAMAARRVYEHRVVLVEPEDERSLLWGSDIWAVRRNLQGVTVEGVIEEVLSGVEVPL